MNDLTPRMPAQPVQESNRRIHLNQTTPAQFKRVLQELYELEAFITDIWLDTNHGPAEAEKIDFRHTAFENFMMDLELFDANEKAKNQESAP